MGSPVVAGLSLAKMLAPKKCLSVSKTFLQIACVRYNSNRISEFMKAKYGNDRRNLYWTSVNDPEKHTPKLESLFYTVPQEQFDQWLRMGLQSHFYRCVKSFDEACIMIRKPAIEIISNLALVNQNLPILKFVLHGRNGCGKSTSLAHVLHYAGQKEWMIVHVPWAADFNRHWDPTAILYSTHSETPRVDQPLAASRWLTHFKAVNESLLKKLDVRTTATYVWNKREQSEAGIPLLEVIGFGLERVKYATDIMGVVLKELKAQSNAGKFKTLVAIDGLNSFWENTTIKREDNRSQVYKAEELSAVHFLKKLVKNDWCNGAVVATVDGNACAPVDPFRHLPCDLLKKEGFELLDPFLPVYVEDYSDKEFYTCLQYFIDNKWFINPHSQTDEGMAEIKSLSCQNPKELYNLGVWM